MLRWPQQRLPKKVPFFFKLSVISALVHAVFCFSLFFMYKDYQNTLLLQVHAKHNPDDVVVRLLPLSVGAKKRTVPVKRFASSSKKVAKKAVPKKKTMQLAQLKKSHPKPQPKVVEKKAVEKQKTATPKPIEKPKIEKQVVKQKEQKVDQPKKISAVEKPQAAKEKPAIKPQQEIKQQEAPLPEENVRYVTHKELRGIELENALQVAVQEVWTPPVGVDAEVVSEVRVTVGWDGMLVESQVIKPSDIVIYDVAVQEALEEMKFPRQVWGKEIKIAFRP